ncbi:MAG TPA: winged helix-turn-helix domain-containing protein [Candidatus Saccharimonadaceae bacterium]|nr:winged helix-turn-helix domain-containing protein [Candidatus Saccharimonadaceae bacterium]
MTKRSTRRATTLTQVRALAHPLRLRLIELFASGPLTAKQAAQKLGQPPTRLYHHVATLERAGLLRLARTRAVRGATEKYFVLAREPLRSLGRDGTDAMRQATSRDRAAISVTLFDRARGELMRALSTGALDKKRPLMAVRALARTTPSGARRLHRDLAAVIQRLQRGKKKGAPGHSEGAGEPESGSARSRGKRQRYSLTIALIPIEDETTP